MDGFLGLLQKFYKTCIDCSLLTNVTEHDLTLLESCLRRHAAFLNKEIEWRNLSVAEMVPAGIFISSTTLVAFLAGDCVIEKTTGNSNWLRVDSPGLTTSDLSQASNSANSIREQGLNVASTLVTILDQYQLPWHVAVADELMTSKHFQDFVDIAPLVEFLLYTKENELLYAYLFNGLETAGYAHAPLRPSWFLQTAIMAYELYGLDTTAWSHVESKPMYLTTWAMLFFQRIVLSTNMMMPFSHKKVPCALMHFPFIPDEELYQTIYNVIGMKIGFGLQTSGQPLENWKKILHVLEKCHEQILACSTDGQRQSGLTISMRGNELLTYCILNLLFFQDARLGFHGAFLLDDELLELLITLKESSYYLWVPVKTTEATHAALQHSNAGQSMLKIAFHSGRKIQSPTLDDYIAMSKIVLLEAPREAHCGIVLRVTGSSLTSQILDIIATKNQGYILSESMLNAKAAMRFTTANGTNLCCEIIASTENGAGNFCFLSNINMMATCPLDDSATIDEAFCEHLKPSLETAAVIMTISMRQPIFNISCEMAKHFRRCYTNPAHGAMIIGRSTALSVLLATREKKAKSALKLLEKTHYNILNVPTDARHTFEQQYYQLWLKLLQTYNPDLYRIISNETLGRFYPCEYRTTQAPGSRNLFLNRHNNEWPGLPRSLNPMQLTFLPAKTIITISSALAAWIHLKRPPLARLVELFDSLSNKESCGPEFIEFEKAFPKQPLLEEYTNDYKDLGELVHQSVSCYCFFPDGVDEKVFIRNHLSAMREKKMITLYYYSSNTSHQAAAMSRY